MTDIESVLNKMNYIIDHSELFPLRMLEDEFGISRKRMSNLRNGLSDLNKTQWLTVVKIVKAYDSKFGEND